MTLADSGVSLTDVYTAQGQVLMGVARWEREQEERAGKAQSLRSSAIARVKLSNCAQAEACGAPDRHYTTEIEVRKAGAEIALLNLELASASDLLAAPISVTLRRKLRHADEELPRRGAEGQEDPEPSAQARKGRAGRSPTTR